MPDSAILEVLRSVDQPGRTRRAVSSTRLKPSMVTHHVRSNSAREIELPEDWRGARPVKLAARGPQMKYTSRQYALLLSSYYLDSGLPKALWLLLNCYEPWWLPPESRPAPSALLVPRIRVMCEEHPHALPPELEDEIERLLEDVAQAADEFRPDWAERLRHYRRCFRRTRQIAEAA